MTRSAFGVEDNRISKAQDDRRRAITAGSAAAGAGVGAAFGVRPRAEALRRSAQHGRQAAAYERGAKKFGEVAEQWENGPHGPNPVESIKHRANERRWNADAARNSKQAKRLKMVGRLHVPVRAAVGGLAAGGAVAAINHIRNKQ